MNERTLNESPFFFFFFHLVIFVDLDETWRGALRATPHMRLRVHDHYSSSLLIGGKRQSHSKFASH
jgi:hypothetical protein